VSIRDSLLSLSIANSSQQLYDFAINNKACPPSISTSNKCSCLYPNVLSLGRRLAGEQTSTMTRIALMSHDTVTELCVHPVCLGVHKPEQWQQFMGRLASAVGDALLPTASGTRGKRAQGDEVEQGHEREGGDNQGMIQAEQGIV
jgi:hypothetical protein